MPSAQPAAPTPPASARRVLIAGASGFIGRELLDLLLADPTVAEVHALVRRPLPLRHERLHQHSVDFARLDDALPQLHADTAFCCLGTTIRVAGSQAAFRAVDQDAVLAFAALARRAGVRHFLSVSAIGASVSSPSFYSRVKGEVEQSLRDAGFPSLSLFQPSLLLGARDEFRFGERVAQVLSVPFGPLMAGPLAPYRPIPGSVVAQAMAAAARQPAAGNGGDGGGDSSGVRVLTWRDMQRLAGG